VIEGQRDVHSLTPMNFTLETRDRRRVRHTFACTLDDTRTGTGTWSYVVRAAGCPDFYEGRFVAVGARDVQPDMLANHGRPEYVAKGITEALFDRVVCDSGRRLISSTNCGPKNAQTEYRSPSADKVWQRLVRARRATYDPHVDRYEFLPPLLVRETDVPQLQDHAPTGFPDNQAELRARVLYVLERNGIVGVVNENGTMVDELERCVGLAGTWTVRLKSQSRSPIP